MTAAPPSPPLESVRRESDSRRRARCAPRPGHTSTLGHPATRQRRQRVAGFVFSGDFLAIQRKGRRQGHGAAVDRSRRAGGHRRRGPAFRDPRLSRHPWFKPVWLAASERSEGKAYAAAAPWRLAAPMPADAAARTVHACVPGNAPKIVFSGLDASVAGEIEGAFAAAGHIVVSNARNYRMDPVVPLLIPEVNADHLGAARRAARGQGLDAAPSSPIRTARRSCWPRRWRRCASSGSSRVVVSTMQAMSGAGYPGVPSLDILGNVVPFIGGEEEKMETETQKILGADGGRAPHAVRISAHTNRVPVLDGHTMTVSVEFEAAPDVAEVIEAMRAFRGRPQELRPAERARSGHRGDDRAEPAAAAARRRSRRRHGRVRRPGARVPGLPREVRRPGPQRRCAAPPARRS